MSAQTDLSIKETALYKTVGSFIGQLFSDKTADTNEAAKSIVQQLVTTGLGETPWSGTVEFAGLTPGSGYAVQIRNGIIWAVDEI